MGEHSPADALVPSIVGEYAVVQHVEMTQSFASAEHSATNGSWSRLEWVVDDESLEAIRAARARAEANIKNSDDSLLWFEEYGSDWIKSVGLFDFIHIA